MQTEPLAQEVANEEAGFFHGAPSGDVFLGLGRGHPLHIDSSAFPNLDPPRSAHMSFWLWVKTNGTILVGR